MDAYIIALTGFGVLVLLTAWLPMLLREMPLSLPIVCVGLGALIFTLPGLSDVIPHPAEHRAWTERMTEIVVIIALMGAGLKLDRTLDWVRAALTWRLLLIAMPLTIISLATVAHTLLGLSAAAAILLAAALAPTDPVLASDVQVGPPGEGNEDQIRYTLTAEAGLNDGLAFPFVNLAIALALANETGQPWLVDWLSIDVFWKLAAGLGMGWLVGRGLGFLTFRLPRRAKLSRTGDGFVALGITALAYGLTEMAHGYGFVAVFVAAVTFRSVERIHDYHNHLHEFMEQLERLAMMVLLVAFGAALSSGGLLSATSWEVVVFALIALFVVRPLSGWLSFLGHPEPPEEKGIISFFGIRGVGSVYYLAFALGHAAFDQEQILWTATSMVILISIVLHGTTVTPLMRCIDRRVKQRSKLGGSSS